MFNSLTGCFVVPTLAVALLLASAGCAQLLNTGPSADDIQKTPAQPGISAVHVVDVDQAIELDRVFAILMGDELEPRRNFIETNGRRVANIDV